MSISLEKGQRISLQKSDGSGFDSFCVGANWGMIDKKGIFGSKKESVDLDLSAILVNDKQQFIDVIYFGKLRTSGVAHSGDDLVGDDSGDDGLDNEVIEVTLNKLNRSIDQIIFVLNSYKGQDFATIPFASIRLYEGTSTSVKNIVAIYNVAKDASFAGHVAMVLGKLYKKNGEWKFNAIGEATKDSKLTDTVNTVIAKYL